ncbi:MAG: c-type cytochrome [Cocleimonas sp.]
MSESHDKLPTFFWVQLALAAAIGVMFLIHSSDKGTEHAAEEGKVETVAKNLKPVGAVTTKAAKTSGSAKARSGEEVYNASCLACHSTGVANAPKPDDKAAWEPRVATGLDALMKTAIDGKGAMPARGGNPAVTDEEIKAAILYMTKKAGFDLGAAKEAPAKVMTETTKVIEKVMPAVAAVIPAAPSAPTPPVAPKAMEAEVAAAPAMDLKKGKSVYDSACFACHQSGVAGSPKLGDKAAWVARIAAGNDVMYTTALKGKGAMPAKGGNMGLSDDDVKAAVDYMVSMSQ